MLQVGRIASEPIHSRLPCAPVQEMVNDAQAALFHVILDKFLTSLDLVAYV